MILKFEKRVTYEIQSSFWSGPSRRLGSSQGVDLVLHKVCTLDCVYCECGATTDLTVERSEYVFFSEVIEELDHFLSNNQLPDYITFSGSGIPLYGLNCSGQIWFFPLWMRQHNRHSEGLTGLTI